MDFKKSKKLLLIIAAVYLVFSIGIYFIAYDQFHYNFIESSAPKGETILGEITDGKIITENIIAPAENISGVEIMAGTYNRINSGELIASLSDNNGNILAEKSFDISSFEDNKFTRVNFDKNIKVTENETLTLTLKTSGCIEGNAVTIYYGFSDNENFNFGESEVGGSLAVKLCGYNNSSAYLIYIASTSIVFISVVSYVLICWKKAKEGKPNFLVSICTVFTRYSFLIKQLVSRDIKTKYKRSALGMAWSIMNPLLSMSVQYIVFSTLFRSDVPNYPVYLLTGIVFFNFFTEALTMGMTAITSNASLIKKVYMPKYIYPVTRVMSSLVNFGCALVPLFIMMILTGAPIRFSLFLLIFDTLCFLSFIIGLTLLLTTAMTFFQDTQFLWGIISLMWQYITPVFYPESIIPEAFLPLYRLNPMYQYISFARICIIDGVSPEPMAYLQCIISSFVFLFIGIIVFKKNQNKFVLYL